VKINKTTLKKFNSHYNKLRTPSPLVGEGWDEGELSKPGIIKLTLTSILSRPGRGRKAGASGWFAGLNLIVLSVCIFFAGCLTVPAFAGQPELTASTTGELNNKLEQSAATWPELTASTATVFKNKLEHATTTWPELSAPTTTWRKMPPVTSFDPGESLQFEVAWQFIVVGYAHMDVAGIVDMKGRKAYHIYTAAKSSSFFDTFYRVRDTNESWIDKESFCSLKYSSRNDEDNRKKDETIDFDQVNHTFTIIESSKTGRIPDWVNDVLSALYYVRTQELVVGKDIEVDAHSGDLSWPLVVKVHRREKVTVPAGEFDCFVVEPVLRIGAGIFQAKGRLLVWLTADDKKIPVLMSSKIVVGSVQARLTGMRLK